MKKYKKILFPLIRGDEHLGWLTWHAGSGKIQGDQSAQKAYQEALDKALAAQIEIPLPRPSTYNLSGRPVSPLELVTLLQFGSFLLPEILEHYLKEMAEEEERHWQEIEQTTREMEKRGIKSTVHF